MTDPRATETPSVRTEVSRLLESGVVAAGVAPGAAACVAVWRNEKWQCFSGAAGTLTHTESEIVIPSTLFDLASITKSMVAAGVGRAVDEGLLTFSSCLGDLLPWAKATQAKDASVELLLAHRAGLDAHRMLFNGPLFHQRVSGANAQEMLIRAANSLRPEVSLQSASAAGFPPLYSDLGYLLLGVCLEHVTQKPLDQWLTATLREWGLGDLGSARQLVGKSVAATEYVPERGGLVQGFVHDENAWAFGADACAGHAGLFGTAETVATFGCRLLDCLAGRARWLSASTLETLLRIRPGGSLRAGFDGKTEGPSSIGNILGPHTFGHLGFTGTSFWCDPEQGLVVSLLTNRVCPSRDNLRIRAVRPTLHDALAKFALGETAPTR